jgi:hypothetical protein
MASFVLRRIDDVLWNRFRAVAQAQGVTPKEALLRAITDYLLRHEPRV